jgi:hypothetical protein
MDAEVFACLLREVEETKRAHEDAKQLFWEITAKPREWPTHGLPNPDGSQFFRRVVACEKYAMRAHLAAMQRMNQFLMDGTIPDDVREKLGKPKTMGNSG